MPVVCEKVRKGRLRITVTNESGVIVWDRLIGAGAIKDRRGIREVKINGKGGESHASVTEDKRTA